MKLRTNQTGAAHIIAFLAIVVLAVVGFAGYKVASTNKQIATTTAATAATPGTIPAILQTKGDVASASNALDSTAIDSSVDPGQLDSDLNALL